MAVSGWLPDFAKPSKRARRDDDQDKYLDIADEDDVISPSPPGTSLVPRTATINLTALTRKLAENRRNDDDPAELTDVFGGAPSETGCSRFLHIHGPGLLLDAPQTGQCFTTATD